MAITIYWACNDESWLRAKTPDSIYKNFVQNPKNQKNNLVLCPATKDYMQNVFSIKSLFDYDFTLGLNEEIQNKLKWTPKDIIERSTSLLSEFIAEWPDCPRN